jgi:hypothetical protein
MTYDHQMYQLQEEDEAYVWKRTKLFQQHQHVDMPVDQNQTGTLRGSLLLI